MALRRLIQEVEQTFTGIPPAQVQKIARLKKQKQHRRKKAVKKVQTLKEDQPEI